MVVQLLSAMLSLELTLAMQGTNHLSNFFAIRSTEFFCCRGIDRVHRVDVSFL